MDLLEYIKDRRISKKEFARRAQISIMSLYNIFKGRMPQTILIDKIEAASNGMVTYYDLKKNHEKKKEYMNNSKGHDDSTGNFGMLSKTGNDLVPNGLHNFSLD